MLSSALSVLIQLSLGGLEKYWCILLWVEMLLGPSVSVLLITDFWAEGKKDALPLSLPCTIFLVVMERHLSNQVPNVLSKKQSFFFFVLTGFVLLSLCLLAFSYLYLLGRAEFQG